MKKKSSSFLDHKAFTYQVRDFDSITQEYTLYNKHTGHIKIVSKERYWEMVEEAKEKKQ